MALSTIDTSSISGLGYGFKNRIINGGMVIDQRNAGASVTVGSGDIYTIDRWMIQTSQASKLSAQQNAGSVTPPVGFTNYLGCTSLAATSIGAGDYFSIQERIEGFNFADLAWGTASAKTVTLSFQVYSSLTGTFGGSLRNGAGNRSYPFTYTVSSANTWTQISITVAGDTSGTWLTTNGIGATLAFGLGVGSTYSGTSGSWSSNNYASATGATSVVGTNGATFYITGVQLEAGTVATSFDWRSYGTELALCQRYYQLVSSFVGAGNGSTQAAFLAQFQTPMRAAPTLGVQGAIQFSDGTTDFLQSSASITALNVVSNSAIFFLPNYTGITANRIAFGPRLLSNTNTVTLAAEL